MTILMFVSVLLLGAVSDAALRRLAADVALAMKRADLSQDYVARVLEIPANKLSLQLSGALPLTTLCRFFTSAELDTTDFRLEFLAMQAARIDRALVTRDLSDVLAGLRLFLRPAMAKMALPEAARTKETA